MADKIAYAHSLAGQPKSEWEPYVAHRDEVAQLARKFAHAFDAGDWGEVLGRWHDLGKLSQEFQDYLASTEDVDAGENEHTTGRVDHSTFGARHAAKCCSGFVGQILAFCIAGHHSGLTDGTSTDCTHEQSTLKHRLDALAYTRCKPVTVPLDDQITPKLMFPFKTIPSRGDQPFSIAFFTRMLFSCLVDADRTATEAFCDAPKHAERTRAKPDVATLRDAVDQSIDQLSANAEPTPVNQIRAQVLSDCRATALAAPGLFSLDVPTGGGKTLASLSFALRHAATNGLRRVVVAIPFTSIIEQTAEICRKSLGPHAELGLIEHHSNIEPKRDTRANKLAAENWDAPLIVTTNVQLFESLFASATTPCRKLHRLANSVIVLDEAQTIPVDLLAPTLRALRELIERYGCSVVLCTATQPALVRREREFEIGLSSPKSIISPERSLHTRLKRVEVTQLGKLADDELVTRLAVERSVLCIVNTRPHASKLFESLINSADNKESCFHLSTFMCAQHRRDVLAKIRHRLKANEPCRVISTQLIEAGVDVDFPIVYRAPAGFDSIAQAAGRCNREGALTREGQPVLGNVYLFDTESPPPIGLLRDAASDTRELLERFRNPLLPEAIEAFFRQFYWDQGLKHQWDKPKVMEALHDELTKPNELQFRFREAARLYRLINDEGYQILVPYDKKARHLIDWLRSGKGVDYQMLRDAQRYLITVRENVFKQLVFQGLICEHDLAGLCLLMNKSAYSDTRGLSLSANGFAADYTIV